MRFLFIEKKVEIRKDFQKLLDNAIRVYGTSKEEIIFKTENEKNITRTISTKPPNCFTVSGKFLILFK